jgi:hypothetical protein
VRTLTDRGSRTHPNWSGQPSATLTVGAAGRGLVGAGGELGLRPRNSHCALAARARGGTSHIAPPDMNSYIKKYEFIYPATYEFIHPYEFIYPVTYEFIHPAKCMNSYVSDPCLVYKQNGH